MDEGGGRTLVTIVIPSGFLIVLTEVMMVYLNLSFCDIPPRIITTAAEDNVLFTAHQREDLI